MIIVFITLFFTFLSTFLSLTCLDYKSNLNKCHICSFDRYTPFSFDNSGLFDPDNCLSKQNTPLFREIFVSSNVQCNNNCSGTLAEPFGNLFEAFRTIMLNVIAYNQSTVNIYLMNDRSHYLYNTTNEAETFHFFRRIYANITITPLFCSYKNITGCFSSEEEKAEIIVKRENVYFFVSSQLKLINIIFNGVDLNIYHDLYQNETICLEPDLESLNSDSLRRNCFIKNKILNINPDNFIYGLFNLEYIIDCEYCATPDLTIINCEFSSINSFAGFSSLIRILKGPPAVIKISKTIFKKLFFPKGIISIIDIKDPYYQFLTTNDFKNLFSQISNKNIDLIMKENMITLFNYYNITFSSRIMAIINLDNDFNQGYFTISCTLTVLFTEDIYEANYFNDNFTRIQSFGNQSIINISNITSLSNNFNYFLIIQNQVNLSNIENSIFLNNSKSAFWAKNNNPLIFNKNIISNHSLEKSLFYLDSSVYMVSNSVFTNIYNYVNANNLISSIFGVKTIVKYNIDQIFYRDYSLNLTYDQIIISNSSFLDFNYICLLHSTSTIKNFFTFNSSFISIFMSTNLQSVFHCNIENIFVVNKTIFKNITAEYVFFLGYSRNRTIQDFGFSNSKASLFYTVMFTPYSFHYMQFYFLSAHIENINIDNINDVSTFIVLYQNYQLDSSDIIIMDVFIENVTFLYSDKSYTNSLILIFNSYYLSIRNLTMKEIANCSAIDIIGLDDPAFHTFVNISDMSLRNEFTKLVYFCGFYYLNFMVMKNATFINGKELNYDAGVYITCYPSCYLAIFDSIFQGKQIVNKGGALKIKYQNIKRILIVNCTFNSNGGTNSSFSDIFLSFMENLDDLGQNEYDPSIMFDNFNIFCLNKDDTSILAHNKSDCIEFNRKKQSNLTIGKDFIFFNLNQWNEYFYTYGLHNLTFANSYSTSIYLDSKANCVMRNITFLNIVLTSYSALFIISSEISLYLYEIHVNNCSSLNEGGAFYLEQASTLFLVNSTFASINSNLSGGVFFLNEASLILQNVTFENTKAEDGGVLYSVGSVVNCSNIVIRKSSVNLMGGSFYMVQSNLTLINSVINESSSNYNGGVLFADKLALLKIISSKISNSITLESGVFYISGIFNITSIFEDIILANNYAKYGSFIYMKEGKALLKSSLLKNNSAVDYLIYSVSSFAKIEFQIEDCVFERNNVTNSMLNFEEGQITFLNIVLEDNLIDSSVIKLKFSNFTISNMSFSFILKEILINGYAVFAFYCTGSIRNSIINITSLVDLGGVISDNSILNIDSTIFIHCGNILGGSLQILHYSNLDIKNSTFIENYAQYGGGIYISNSYLNCESLIFLRNNAKFQGSDIFISNTLITSSQLSIINSIFKDFNSISTVLIQISFVNLSNNTYSKNNLGSSQSQAIFLEDVASLTILKSYFSGLKSLSAIQASNKNSKLNIFMINSSYFLNCSTNQSGGAIYLIGNFNLSIHYCEFINNSAIIDGGVLFLSCQTINCFDYDITKNSFSNNTALSYGGVMKLPSLLQNFLLINIFMNNSAKIGDILTTDASKLYITTNFTDLQQTKDLYKPLNISSSLEILSISSGQTTQIYVLILDNLLNFLRFEDSGEISLKIQINASSNEYILNPTKYQNLKLLNAKAQIKSGKAFFSSLILIAQPGENYTGSIMYSNSDLFFEQNLTFQVLLCKTGEIFINSQCIPCGPGFFSLDNETFLSKKNSCEVCPPNALCLGYDKLLPLTGYWKFNSKSTIMIECYNSDNCPDQTANFLSNTESYVYQCQSGSYGNLCSNCIDGFGKDTNGICHICTSESTLYIRFFIFSFLSILFLLYQSYVALNFNEVDIIKRSMLKILINHNYYLSFLQGMKVDWIGDIKAFSTYSDLYATSVPKDILNFDCFLSTSFKRESIPIAKVVIFSFFPLILFLILLVLRVFFLALSRLFSKLQSKRKLKKKRINDEKKREIPFISEFFLIVGACLLITVYNYYSRLIMNTLQLLKCVELDQNISFLLLDPNIQCWDGYHEYLLKTLFLLNFLLWCVGWPLFLFLLLKVKNYKSVRQFMKSISMLKSRVSPLNKSIDKSFLAKNSQTSIKAINPIILKAEEREDQRGNKELDDLIRKNSRNKIFPIIPSKTKESNFKMLYGSEKKIPLDKSLNLNRNIQIVPNFGSEKLLSKFSPKKQSKDHNTLNMSNQLILKNVLKQSIDIDSLRKNSVNSQDSNQKKDSILKRISKNFSISQEPKLVLNLEQKDQIFQKNKIFRFLTIDYRADCYYWEGFFYLSNLVIATLNVTTITLDSNTQGGIFIMVYFSMLILNQLLKPFRYDSSNKLASFSYLTIIITIGLVLMSITSVSFQFQSSLYFALMVFLNCVFYIFWGYKFGKIVVLENLAMLRMAKRFIKQKTSRYFNKRIA